jgi:phage terminase Nu1 subunit (DNA packaging protein)
VVRAGRGRYDLERSVRNVIARLRKTVAHRGDAESLETVRSERIRLTRAQAQEIKNAHARAARRSGCRISRRMTWP